MYGYAFCGASRYWAESWYGDKGLALKICGHISKWPPPKVKGRLKTNLFFQECPMETKFDRKKPWPKCNSLSGSKVTQVSTEVNQRSNCLEMPLVTNFGQRNPGVDCETCVKAKVVQGSSKVNQWLTCHMSF